MDFRGSRLRDLLCDRDRRPVRPGARRYSAGTPPTTRSRKAAAAAPRRRFAQASRRAGGGGNRAVARAAGGIGLLIRSFLRLQEVDAGFRADGVLTMRISLPARNTPSPSRPALLPRLLDRAHRLPGVDAAGAVSGLPLSGTGWSGTTTIDTQAVPEKETTPEADQRPVSPGYFEAMGIGLVRGRYFDQRDTETSAMVAIVDETLAKTYWPRQDPVGKRIRQGGSGSTVPGATSWAWCGTSGTGHSNRLRAWNCTGPYAQTASRSGQHEPGDSHLR